MTEPRHLWLVVRALYELGRYDAMHFNRPPDVHRQLARGPNAAARRRRESEAAICRAFTLALCFYWKSVQCLQRSVCLARLLRAYGVPARLVIGYRPVPFLSHAWVQVDERVVNDSPVYARRLRVLLTA